MCVCTCVHIVSQEDNRGQLVRVSSLPAMWAPRIEFSLSGLVTSSFPLRAICQPHFLVFIDGETEGTETKVI